MKNRILFLFFLLMIIFSGCETLDRHIILSEDEKRLIGKIDEADILIMEYKLTGDNEKLLIARKILLNIEDDIEENNRILARIYGLKGYISLLKNNNIAVYDIISQIEYINKNEEMYYYLKAFLEKKEGEKRKIIDEGIKKAETNLKLKLVMANYYFADFKFNKALNLFDEVFVKLPHIYIDNYKNIRELTYQFVKNPPQSKETPILLTGETISIKDMLRLLSSETDLLLRIDINEYSTLYELYKKLSDKGFFINEYNKTNINDLFLRKDAAFFIINIIAELEDNPDLLNTGNVNDDFVLFQDESPIPDINNNDIFINAVLRLVEREVMELPDGINFFPYQTISPMEFYEILMKIK